MMSGNDLIVIRTAISRLIILPLMLCANMASMPAFAAEPEATSWSLVELMHGMAQVKKSKATYVERKHLSMLNIPLSSSGKLEYTAPDQLEKHMLLPRLESLLLDQNKLVVINGETGDKRSLPLQEYPAVWAFVESIRSTLAGDLETLKRFYDVKFNGQQKQWQLILIPSDSKTKNMVSEILIKGSFEQIKTIEIHEAGGDYSVMSISKEGL